MDIIDYKKKHRLVFCTNLIGLEIYWRLLTFKEFNIYEPLLSLDTSTRSQVEDIIFREVVLNESIVDKMNTYPPGVVPSIVNTVISLSGKKIKDSSDLNEINESIDITRDKFKTSVYDQIIMYICMAFPSYTPTQVEDLPHHEILRLLVMAESILKLPEPINFQPESKKNITQSLLQDTRSAREADMGSPDLSNLTYNQAKEIEMINLIKQRNSKHGV